MGESWRYKMITIREDPKKEGLYVYEKIKSILEPEYKINHSIIGEYTLKKGQLDCIVSIETDKKFILIPYKSVTVICNLIYRFPDIGLVTDDSENVMQIAKKLENDYNVTIIIREDYKKRI